MPMGQKVFPGEIALMKQPGEGYAHGEVKADMGEMQDKNGKSRKQS